MASIIELYDTFRKLLVKRKNEVAYLQMTGRIEEYLVHEFMYHIYIKSKHKLHTWSNIGKKNELKRDIAIFSGPYDNPSIIALIEAKYLRNCHREDVLNSAFDEVKKILSSLEKQLRETKKRKHANFDLNLKAKKNQIYGLIFASFISNKKNDSKKTTFYKNIIKISDKFRYHDYSYPFLLSIYDDVKVAVLGELRYATLKMGLWKLKEEKGGGS